MTVLNRKEARTRGRAKETVEVNVPDLPGDVVVQALRLPDRFEMAVGERTNFERIPYLLSLCVVDNEGEPFGDEDWWSDFGSYAENTDVCLKLWDKARILSGFDAGAAQKNDEAPS